MMIICDQKGNGGNVTRRIWARQITAKRDAIVKMEGSMQNG